MHELVHACNMSCAFFCDLSISKGYPSIFVFGTRVYMPRDKKDKKLTEDLPKTIEINKKILMKNFFRKFF